MRLYTEEDILKGLNPEQKEVVTSYGQPLLTLAGAGSGKCVQENTRLHSNKGYLRIKDYKNFLSETEIKEGNFYDFKDNILVRDNQISDKFYYNGFVDTIKIKSKKFELEATPIHPIKVLDREQGVVWKQLQDISLGDLICCDSKVDILFNNETPKPSFLKHLSEREYGWFVGFFMGDGSIWTRGDKPVTVSFCKREQILDYIKDELVPNVHWSKVKDIRSKVSYSLSHNSVEDIGELVGLGVCGKSNDKRLPDWVFSSNREFLVGLLSGYIDSDGYGRNLELSSKSEELIKGIRDIFNLFGIYPSLTDKFVRYKGENRLYKKLSFWNINNDKLKILDLKVDYKKEQLNLITNKTDWSVNNQKVLFTIPYKKELLNLYENDIKINIPYSERGKEIALIKESKKDRRDYFTKYSWNNLKDIIIEGSLKNSIIEHDLNNYEFIEVEEINTSKSMTYDISVPSTNTYTANGIVSHNTSTLTKKICHLVLVKNIPIERVLAVTFTNKASQEMQERVMDYMGIKKKPQWISTFHSLGIKILKGNMSKIDFKEEFTIYDGNESKTIVKNIVEPYVNDNSLNVTIYNEDNIRSMISRVKLSVDFNEGLQNLKKDFISMDVRNKDTYFEHIENMFNLYQDTLKQNNALDFDDLLVNSVKILKSCPDTLSFWQEKFDYIMADEYQDTNGIQYEMMKLLIGERNKNNVMVVGDPFQCFPSGTLMNTSSQPISASGLKVGDCLLTTQSKKLISSKVTNISKSENRRLLKITTNLGKKLSITPNHKCFVTDPEMKEGTYYVYLMYHRKYGFRIGMTQGSKDKKNLYTRMIMESGDRIWLLLKTNSKNDCRYYEDYYSLKYMIPKNVFRATGRAQLIDQDLTDKLFEEYGNNGYHLLDDFGYSFDLPNYIPQGGLQRKSSNVYLYLNHKNKNYVSYEYDGLRHRKAFSNFKEAYEHGLTYYNSIEKDYGIFIEQYQFEDKILLNALMASQLLPSMKIPVLHEGKLILDEIVSIEKIEESDVYDIEIAETGVIIANDVLTHNSIYGWRGARAENILEFDKDFKGSKIIKLESNYRSTPNILEFANKIVGQSRVTWKDKIVKLKPTLVKGHDVSVIQYSTDEQEAQTIVNQIQMLTRKGDFKYQDFTVLMRMSFISRIIEEYLIRYRIPYQIIGGLTFYERAEIKTLLSYLKFAVNTNDKISLDRMINIPSRTLGKQALEAIKNHYTGDWLEAIKITAPTFRGNASNEALKFVSLIQEINPIANTEPNKALKKVIQSTNYYQYLQSKFPDNYEDRIGNVNELLNLLQRLEDNGGNFLEFLAEYVTASAQDDVENKTNKVKIMTIHASKGLEFPVVFIPALEDGLLPSARSVTNEQLEEERRLFYVAVTRAKKICLISSARQRGYASGGQKQQKKPSRFLNGLIQK